MTILKDLNYIPRLPYHARVRFIRKGHAKFDQCGVVVAALPNPSNLPENQWYDVRFDDAAYGRFRGRDLYRIPPKPLA